MPNTIEIIALRPGLRFADNKPLLPKTPFQFGNDVHIRDARTGIQLNLSSLKAHDNGIGVECLTDSPSDVFKPSRKATLAKWEYYFGNHPNLGVNETFGNPSALQVKYLGHPLRDRVEAMFANLRGADGVISLEEKFVEKYWGKSKPIKGNVYGLDADSYTVYTDQPEIGFDANSLVLVNTKVKLGESLTPMYWVSASIATKAVDGVVRVQEARDPVTPLSQGDFSAISGKVARLSLVVDNFAELATKTPALNEGIPLTELVRGMNSWLEYGEVPSKRLKESGIDLVKILDGADAAAVLKKQYLIESTMKVMAQSMVIALS